MVFHCPQQGCSQSRSYQDLVQHVKGCVPSSIEAAKEEELKQNMAEEVIARQDLEPLVKIYIYEKDSKKVHIYDATTVSVNSITLPIENQFPHNFQIC
jgi:hypothetical protein